MQTQFETLKLSPNRIHDNISRDEQPQSIIRVQALKNYSRIYYLNGQNYVVCRTLQVLQNALPPTDFVRVHRSHLVNKHFIHTISGAKKNELQLRNGETIVMSRRQKMKGMAG
jgi:two-component system LytT family response regulator